jgi:hypothetical protein
MAMFKAAPSSRDIQGQYPQRLSPNSPIGAETFSAVTTAAQTLGLVNEDRAYCARNP